MYYTLINKSALKNQQFKNDDIKKITLFGWVALIKDYPAGSQEQFLYIEAFWKGK